MATISGGTGWELTRHEENKQWTYDTPLAANDTLVSPAFPLLGAAEFIANIDTDSNCTLWIDLSLRKDPDPTDDSHWDRNIPRAVLQTVGSGGLRTVASGSTYARIRVVNGSSAQGELRVLVKINKHAGAGLTSSMNQSLSIGDEVRLMRPTNKVASDVALGFFADRFSLVKFGANPDVGTGAYEDIWGNGGTYPWPTAAETVRVKAGGNAADDSGGAGAQKVMVDGLDENWDIATEEITLAGSSASSATTTTFIRINRMWVTDVGTYGVANTGVIVLENTSSNDVLAHMAAGVGQTQQAIYTVPADYKAIVSRISTSVASTKPATVRMFRRENADDVTTPFTGKRLQHINQAAELNIDENLDGAFFVFPEKTDIWFDALASAVGGATTVEVDFDLELQLQISTTPQ